MRPYTELPSLAAVALEESYVLGIEAQPGTVIFSMEYLLAVDHDLYLAPPPGKEYTAHRGTLTFTGVTELTWIGQGNPPARDATGELDYGNIDSFEWEDSRFTLEGSWGRMNLNAAGISVDFVLE